MRFDYVVTLKREKEKYIDATSIFLCILSIAAFVIVQIQQGKVNLFFCVAATILIAGLGINVFASRNKHQIVRYKNWLIIAGIFWVGMPNLQWVCMVFFFLAFLEYQAKYPLEIGFSKDVVVMNTLIRKRFSWDDFTNIMLRDGLLTMDFKNNRILQKQTVDDQEDYDADEEEFNDYCRGKLINTKA
jgi:hypothetical protein